MKKSEKTAFILGIFILISFIYFTNNPSETPIISGMAIKDFVLFQKISNFNFQTKIFMIQWIIVIFISAFVSIKYFKKKMKEKGKIQEKKIYVHSKGGKTYTDLDDFYKMLMTNKKTKISQIVKEFNICKEKALEWAKIFEDEGIVEINYPAFFEPEVKLKINKKEDEDEEDEEEDEEKGKCNEKEIKKEDKMKLEELKNKKGEINDKQEKEKIKEKK